MERKGSRPASALIAGWIAGTLAFAMPSLRAEAQVTTFTYQGVLRSAGDPYTGSADVEFVLCSDANATSIIGSPIVLQDVAIADGQFSVPLDFGVTLLLGAHLQVSVRVPSDPTNTGEFTMLLPRQPVRPAPMATNALYLNGQTPGFYQSASSLSSGTLPAARLAGTYNLSVSLTSPANNFNGSGANLINLNAANIAIGVLSPARGGTGSSLSGAPAGHVLKWSGSAFTPQPDLDTTYLAGTGLALAGTTFSIANNAISSSMLASDSASLAKVSGNRLAVTANGVGSDFPLSVTNTVTAGDFAFNSPVVSHQMIDESRFVSRDGVDVACASSTPGAYPIAATTAGLVAPIDLPNGAQIIAIRVFLVDNNATINLQARLVRLNMASGTTAIGIATSTTGSSQSVQLIELGDLGGPVDEQAEALQLYVVPTNAWTGNSARVLGARVTYTIPKPAR